MSDGSNMSVGARAEGRRTTPEKSGSGNKACSTPTNIEDTISDMTLDASCITAAKSKVNLDETVKSHRPVLKMRSVTAAKPKPVRNTVNTGNKTMLVSNRFAWSPFPIESLDLQFHIDMAVRSGSLH